MESSRDDTKLAAALRALRPAPRPAFAAELDERAAAGFPRRSAGGSLSARLLAAARALRPRQVLLPAGATALAAIVVATAVVAVNGPGSGDPSVDQVAVGEQQGGTTPEVRLNSTTSKPDRLSEASSGSATTQSSTEYKGAFPSAASGTDRYASGANHRDVEHSAELVLGADPAEVGDNAAKVFDAVHAYDGIVLRSSIRNGSEGDAGAEFDLLIPSAKLSDALAAFSGIAEVRSRHEATADITAPTVTVSEHLRDSRARIDGLLAQLAEASTEAEREAVEAELQTERRRTVALRSRLAGLHRRANLSRVSLRIETDAASASSSGDARWGIGDALADAGRIVAIATGVTLIGLAVLTPLALIGLLAWLAHRARVRQSRSRALS